MNKILSIDTSTEISSVALLVSGKVTQVVNEGNIHSKSILVAIEGLLADAKLGLSELDAIAYGQGPGSFTGLRVAASVVQGLAYPNKLPILPVSTLRALAKEFETNPVLSVIDARMQEIYAGVYLHDKSLIPDGLFTADNIDYMAIKAVIANSQLQVVGTGVVPYQQLIEQNLAKHNIDYKLQTTPIRAPQAALIAKCALADFLQGSYVEGAMAVPYYIRDDVAKKSVKRS